MFFPAFTSAIHPIALENISELYPLTTSVKNSVFINSIIIELWTAFFDNKLCNSFILKVWLEIYVRNAHFESLNVFRKFYSLASEVCWAVINWVNNNCELFLYTVLLNAFSITIHARICTVSPYCLRSIALNIRSIQLTLQDHFFIV